MWFSWQAGAETLEHVTFGEQSLEEKIGAQQKDLLGVLRFRYVLMHYWCDHCSRWGKSGGGRLT